MSLFVSSASKARSCRAGADSQSQLAASPKTNRTGRTLPLALICTMTVTLSLSLSLSLSLMTTSADAATCPNEPVRTGPSAALPDCRAYELVTPERVDAAGGDLEFNEQLATALASGDGEHLALDTKTVFLEPGAHHTGTDAVFSRTVSGWVMRSLTAPGTEGESFTPELFSKDLSLTGFLTFSGLNEAAPRTLDIGPVGGPYTPVVTTRRANATTIAGTRVVGANAGAPGVAPFSDVVFESGDPEVLPPGPERLIAEGTLPDTQDLYVSVGGQLRLVNLDSQGKLPSLCGAELGSGEQAGNAVNAVSADGSRMLFQSPPSKRPGCPEPALYMRVNGRETVDVGEPQEGVVVPPGERGGVEFDGASPDGSRVFFTSETALTPGAGVGPHLYLYTTTAAAGHRLKLVATGVARTGHKQNTNPFVLVSGDGNVIYYQGTEPLGVLGHLQSVTGIWRYDSATEQSTYVATISPGRYEEEALYASFDGRFLAFMSGHEGVQVLGPHGLEVEPRGVGNQQLYRYDAATGRVTCVSRGEGVAPAIGWVQLAAVDPAGIVSGMKTGGGLAGAVDMSNDGGRVFFQTTARLVPQDTNEDTDAELTEAGHGTRATDVYEWVAPGAEDGPGAFCHVANGCTFLLSAGESVGPEQFLGASEDGRDVFLSSAASLVPGAPSGFTSIYDARIGGGFPQKAGPVECNSCQGVGNPPPSFGTPSSATFAGAGNPPLPPPPGAGAPKSKPKPKPKPRCRHGYRRNRHGRCARVAHKTARSRH
jgi:hypothetical protein